MGKTAPTSTPVTTPDRSTAEVDSIVDPWFREHFCDRSPALDPEAYNIAYNAAQDLKKRLAALPNAAS